MFGNDKSNFKLNYYFEEFKDKPFRNRNSFRMMFRKKYGGYEHVNELIVKIEEYQVKKYGSRIADFFEKKTKEIRIKEQQNSNRRLRQRLGKE